MDNNTPRTMKLISEMKSQMRSDVDLVVSKLEKEFEGIKSIKGIGSSISVVRDNIKGEGCIDYRQYMSTKEVLSNVEKELSRIAVVSPAEAEFIEDMLDTIGKSASTLDHIACHLTRKADTEGFINEFREEISKVPGVRRIEFFGSVLDRDRYKPGKSNLDALVFGKTNKEKRKKIFDKTLEMSDKYGMFIEEAPYLHPIPFFMRSRIENRLMNMMFIPPLSLFTTNWRKGIKDTVKLTLEERMEGKKPAALTRLAELLWGVDYE